jgi:hypothetical protein
MYSFCPFLSFLFILFFYSFFPFLSFILFIPVTDLHRKQTHSVINILPRWECLPLFFSIWFSSVGKAAARPSIDNSKWQSQITFEKFSRRRCSPSSLYAMYVCMYVCMYVPMHVCMYVFARSFRTYRQSWKIRISFINSPVQHWLPHHRMAYI